MGEPNVFVFTGHGYDNPTIKYKDRKTLPEGFTLITFTQCGEPSNLWLASGILGKMHQTEPFANPDEETLRALLGVPVKIYKPGDPYPPLFYMPVGDHIPPPEGGKKHTFFFRSGVYKLPITLVSKPGWEVTDAGIVHSATGYTFGLDAKPFASFGEIVEGVPEADGSMKPDLQEAAVRSLQGAVYPPEDIFRSILTNKIEVNGFPIEEVFTALKPGVYYWPICRGDITDEPPEAQAAIQITRAQSALRGTKKGGRRRRKARKTKRVRRRY